MGYLGKQPSAVPLTSDDITDNIITSAKIVNGAITGDDINSTFNIGSKTVTLPAASVTAHATDFDDNKIVNDLSTLALRQSSNENKAAYNTNSMYVDVFQDSTGITGITQTYRNANEYVSTSTLSSTTYSGLSPTYSQIGDFGSGWGSAGQQHGKMTDGTANGGFGTNPPQSNDKGMKIDMGQTYTFNSGSLKLGNHRTHGDPRQWKVTYSTNDSSYSNVDFSSCSASTVSSNGSISAFTSGTSAGLINIDGHDSNGDYSLINITTVPTFEARYIKVILTQADYHDNNAYIGQFDWGTVSTGTFYTTGSFTSNNITAPSSTSKMGAIITYQDNAGTNTLNTDIVLKLSADGGSNYATATLVAMPDFATGIKMAKVNDLSVTAGTSLKYKLEFANQASGSKEARIRGVSLQY